MSINIIKQPPKHSFSQNPIEFKFQVGLAGDCTNESFQFQLFTNEPQSAPLRFLHITYNGVLTVLFINPPDEQTFIDNFEAELHLKNNFTIETEVVATDPDKILVTITSCFCRDEELTVQYYENADYISEVIVTPHSNPIDNLPADFKLVANLYLWDKNLGRYKIEHENQLLKLDNDGCATWDLSNILNDCLEYSCPDPLSGDAYFHESNLHKYAIAVAKRYTINNEPAPRSVQTVCVEDLWVIKGGLDNKIIEAKPFFRVHQSYYYFDFWKNDAWVKCITNIQPEFMTFFHCDPNIGRYQMQIHFFSGGPTAVYSHLLDIDVTNIEAALISLPIGLCQNNIPLQPSDISSFIVQLWDSTAAPHTTPPTQATTANANQIKLYRRYTVKCHKNTNRYFLYTNPIGAPIVLTSFGKQTTFAEFKAKQALDNADKLKQFKRTKTKSYQTNWGLKTFFKFTQYLLEGLFESPITKQITYCYADDFKCCIDPKSAQYCDIIVEPTNYTLDTDFEHHIDFQFKYKNAQTTTLSTPKHVCQLFSPLPDDDGGGNGGGGNNNGDD